MQSLLAVVDVNAFDAALLRYFNCDFGSPALDTLLRVVQDKWIAVPVFLGVLLLIALRDRRRCLRAVAVAGAAWGISMLLASLLWVTLERPRPTTAYGAAHWLQAEAEISACAARPGDLVVRGHPAASPGFPSRHALTAGVFAMVLTLGWGWIGGLGWIYALLVAIARVHRGVHWPTDVIAGLALGALAAWRAWRDVPFLLGCVGLRRLVEADETGAESAPDSDLPRGDDADLG